MIDDHMGDVSGEASDFTPVPPTAYALASGAHFEGGRGRPPESPDNELRPTVLVYVSCMYIVYSRQDGVMAGLCCRKRRGR